MNRERLEKLAAFLETVPEERFNIEFWGQEKECGFAGCAVGWATTMQEFRDAGLGLYYIPAAHTPSFEGRFGFSAVEKFFGLTPQEVDSLFTQNGYDKHRKVTPKEVTSNIRAFLTSKAL